MRIISFLIALQLAGVLMAAEPTMTDIFVSGQDGYHTYRIPAIVASNDGTLLAFAEGRKNSGGDSGDIDMLVKRSTDGGQTWSPQIVIWDDGENTCGNPCPVVDRSTGVIWLLMTHNPGVYRERALGNNASDSRTVWVTHSDDDGLTWDEPTDITASTKNPNWDWYATGPGIGVQLERGEHPGRLLIPANHDTKGSEQAPSIRGAHSIYSDDHGQTWTLSDNAIQPNMNESQLVELSDGRVMTNMRSYYGDARRRYSLSDDGGTTWGPAVRADELVEPVCQASILRYSWPDDGNKSRILFSNPAKEKGRDHMTIRLSYDEGFNWPVSKLLYEGQAAYSCLVRLPDGRIGCYFEADKYKRMTLAVFDLAWLTDGRDSGK